MSVNTSPFLPAASGVSLLPERQDAHAIVLSWLRPHWLSNVELIKDNLQGVSVPVKGIKSWWQSDRPLIIILLLVRMGEIITLQAQSAGTLSVYFSLFPCPQSPIFISSNSTLSFPLSLTLISQPCCPAQILHCALIQTQTTSSHFVLWHYPLTPITTASSDHTICLQCVPLNTCYTYAAVYLQAHGYT